MGALVWRRARQPSSGTSRTGAVEDEFMVGLERSGRFCSNEPDYHSNAEVASSNDRGLLEQAASRGPNGHGLSKPRLSGLYARGAISTYAAVLCRTDGSAVEQLVALV